MGIVGLEAHRLLRREEVERLTGISRSTLYDMISKGVFPRPVRINARAVGWRVTEVVAWLESRPPASATDWR